MTPLLDTALGARGYLNAGQLLHALPRPAGLTRVRVRFRRLATRPGRWTRTERPDLEETARATLELGGRLETVRFATLPGHQLRSGAAEPACAIRDLTLKGDPNAPSSADLRFEGPVWTAMIEACKLIAGTGAGGPAWYPVCVDGGPFLLDPAPVAGHLQLERLQDRLGVRFLRGTLTGRGSMTVGLATVE